MFFQQSTQNNKLPIINCYVIIISNKIRVYNNLTKFKMSGETKSKEVLSTNRLLIPTPTQGLVRGQNDDNSALLRVYFANYQRLKKEQSTLTNQLAIIQQQREQLKQRLDIMRKQQQEKRKRHRRSAGEISRNFECPVQNCERKYGSEGSLLQHIKIKHTEYYNSEQYEALVLSKHKKHKERLIAYSLNAIVPK